MLTPFTYVAYPTRVVFGPGRLRELGAELDKLGVQRALLLSTPEQAALAEQVKQQLGNAAVGIYARATMHTPVEITEDAVAQLRALGADGLVALGGGSTIGLGKAIAVRSNLPQIVIPTTYAGSEMTPILGETRDGLKTTQRNPKILPETVIYDVNLTLSLPPALSVTSGVNAIAHAVEALYAADRNPIISLMAGEGIASLARSLPAILTNPADTDARSGALYGAWLCGACLGAVGMALHHKLCHTLGGTFNLPHAETHAVVLPHAIAYNSQHAPEAMARVANALGATDAAGAIFDLTKRLGAKQALRDIGMPEAGIDRVADLAVHNPYPNPRPIERQAIRELIARAWAGDPPQV
jgi:alcohol dehydrogenase class IV